MALINPHVNFNGNAEEAFTFYKSVFGGEFDRLFGLRNWQVLNFR
jgi:PhnB protein